MTKQETFDKVVRALRAQGKKSIHAPNLTSCAYRGYDGCKCAAGHLISDEDYREEMESVAVMADDQMLAHVANDRRARVELVRAALRAGGHDLALARDLQGAHDQAADDAFVADFIMRARSVAADHGLNTEACA